MTTVTLYPARKKKRLSDLLASIETFVTVKYVGIEMSNFEKLIFAV